MTMQSILAALFLLLLPDLIKQWGISAIYKLEMATILPCIALALNLHQDKAGSTQKINKFGIGVFTTLSGLVFFSIAQGALWAFIERIGNSAHLTADYIGITLTAATILGIAGGFASALQSKTIGHKKALAAVFGGQTLSIFILWITPDPTFYLVAICLFNFLWIYAIAFQLGVVALKDKSGKSCALATTFQALGLAIGAALAGRLFEMNGNFDLVYLAILVTGAMSLYLITKPSTVIVKQAC
jgi:predicted MFS family arabinose efflux permease